MNANHGLRRALAAQLEAGSRGYGAGAAEKLGELTNISDTFSAWLEFYAQRVVELAAAVLLDEPMVSAFGFAWSGDGMRAREAMPPRFGLQIEALRRSMREDLADPEWDLISGLLDAIEVGDPGWVGSRARLQSDGKYQTYALQFLERSLRGDWRTAIEELESLQRSGVGLRDLFERVLLPAAAEMGTMWHLEEVGVSEEHAATEAILNAMGVLWHQAERQAPNGKCVVVGSVTSDHHNIGVRATAWLMELAGCTTACLGSDLPAPDFARAVADYDADGIVIGGTLVSHLPRIVETIEAVQQIRPEILVIVGGPVFDVAPDLMAKVGANALAMSPGEAVALMTSDSP